MNAHPLAQLHEAESRLVAAIQAATARVDAVGTSSVEAALEQYHRAADAAARRLAGFSTAVRAIAADVLADLGDVADEIEQALQAGNANAAPPPPAPVRTLEDIAPAEPTPEEVAAHEAEAWRDTADQADPLDNAPYVVHNEPAAVDIPTAIDTPAATPALAVGHHAIPRPTPIEKYPCVQPDDQSDAGPSLFDHADEVATVAACSPVGRDDRPPDNGKRRRKSR